MNISIAAAVGQKSFAAARYATIAAAFILLSICMLALPHDAKADVWASGGGPVHGSDGCAMAELQSLSTYGPQDYVFGCSETSGGSMVLFNANGTCTNPPACTSGASRGGQATFVGCDTGYATSYNSPTPPSCFNSAPPPLYCPPCGDPINSGSGQLEEHEVDYESAGPFPLRLERFYLSNPRTDMFNISLFAPSPWISATGGVWRSNFDVSAKWWPGNGTSAAPQYIYIGLPDGRQLAFVSPNANNVYVPALVKSSNVSAGGAGVKETLTLNQSAQTLTVVLDSGVNYVIKFSAASLASNAAVNSQLTKINYPGGYSQSLTYDAGSGLLTAVTDSLGRRFGFQYASAWVMQS